MNYKSLLYALLLSITTGSMHCHESSPLTLETTIQTWLEKNVAPLSPEHIQLMANILLYSHRLETIDSYLRATNHLLLDATLNLYTDVLHSCLHNTELASINNYIKNINALASYYQQALHTWHACKNLIQDITDESFIYAFETLQDYARNYTEQYMFDKHNTFQEHVKQALISTQATIQTLQKLNQAYQHLLQDKRDLIEIVDSAWCTQEKTLQTIHSCVQRQLLIFDYIEKIQVQPSQFYRYCYEQLYNAFDTFNVPDEYRTQLFDEHGNRTTQPLPLPNVQDMIFG